VDLVDTGNTLKANGLVEVEHIADISAWLVANKASMKMKHQALKGLIGRLQRAVA
jgi:ATP phosphoribosyltransferase